MKIFSTPLYVRVHISDPKENVNSKVVSVTLDIRNEHENVFSCTLVNFPEIL